MSLVLPHPLWVDVKELRGEPSHTTLFLFPRFFCDRQVKKRDVFRNSGVLRKTSPESRVVKEQLDLELLYLVEHKKSTGESDVS